MVSRVDVLAVVHHDGDGAGVRVNSGDDTQVAVVGAYPGLGAVALIGDVVVVFDLHNLIAQTQNFCVFLGADLRFAAHGRVEDLLQASVQLHTAGGADFGRAKHLNILDRVEPVGLGQAAADQVADQLLAGKAGGLDHKKVVLRPAFLGHMPFDNAVGVLHDQTLLRLTEDVGQANSGHDARAQDLAQNVAGADAGQLVGIAYHNDTAVIPRRRQQCLKQLDVHHAHLVEDDDIVF